MCVIPIVVLFVCFVFVDVFVVCFPASVMTAFPGDTRTVSEDSDCTSLIIIIILVVVIIMMMIIMIIALKGAIQDFLQSHHCAVNCLQHVRSSGQGAVVCKSRATH